MKLLYLLLVALLFCSIATAAIEDMHPYTIRVIAWDVHGTLESDVPVTLVHAGQSETLYTSEDGTLAFSTLNFDNVPDGAYINVSCKYGHKLAPVNHEYGATGVTFNEPSQAAAISMWAALGFAATAIGGGMYLLRRKKNNTTGDNMDEPENKTVTVTETTDGTGWKLKNDFGVRALIATISVLGYVGISAIAVYQNNTETIGNISKLFMPVVTSIVLFYFGGSIIRDGLK